MKQETFNSKRKAATQAGGAPKSLPGRVVEPRRRKKVSLWRHTFGAISLCLVIALGVASYIDVFGDEGDAIPKQRVELSAPPQPAAFDSLNGNGQALPDLLGDDVAMGSNPTDAIAQGQKNTPRLDALGNPIGSAADDIMAGRQTAPTSQVASSVGNITINGQSIGSGLIKAPAAGLSRNTPYGAVPARAADGRTAFKVYSRPYTAASGTKPISLIIGGLGINRALTRRAIDELPAEVSLAFAAHAPNLQSQIDSARARGHEVLLELPLESESFDPAEPGAEWALRSGSDNATQNRRNLDRLLSRASGYFAVTNYNGGSFLQRSDNVVPMMATLSTAGLGFVFDGSITAPSLPTLANASRLPFLKAFSLIDSSPDSTSIQSELDRMVTLAQTGTAPVGVGFTYPQTIDAVAAWSSSLETKGLTLAPVSSRIPSK